NSSSTGCSTSAATTTKATKAKWMPGNSNSGECSESNESVSSELNENGPREQNPKLNRKQIVRDAFRRLRGTCIRHLVNGQDDGRSSVRRDLSDTGHPRCAV